MLINVNVFICLMSLVPALILSELAVNEAARLCTSQTLQYASSQAGHAQIPDHSRMHIESTGASPTGEGVCSSTAPGCLSSLYVSTINCR